MNSIDWNRFFNEVSRAFAKRDVKGNLYRVDWHEFLIHSC